MLMQRKRAKDARNCRTTLTRQQLARAICNRAQGLSLSESKRLVDAFFEELAEALASGEDINLYGFGIFAVRLKKERLGHNPRTNSPARITARAVLIFRASRTLRAAINRRRPSGEPDM